MPIDRFVAAMAAEQISGSDRFLLLMGSAFCIWMAVRGVSTGKVPLHFVIFKRSNGELLFWFGIGINILIGIMCLLFCITGRDFLK